MRDKDFVVTASDCSRGHVHSRAVHDCARGSPDLGSPSPAAARLFTDQAAYKSIVIDGSCTAVPPFHALAAEGGGVVGGTAACLLAFCIALLTIFRKKVPLGAMFDLAERAVRLLREWQSGHPGDYVAWLTFGTAALGGCFALLLR